MTSVMSRMSCLETDQDIFKSLKISSDIHSQLQTVYHQRSTVLYNCSRLVDRNSSLSDEAVQRFANIFNDCHVQTTTAGTEIGQKKGSMVLIPIIKTVSDELAQKNC